VITTPENEPGRICFGFAKFPFSFRQRPPREMQTPCKATDSQTTVPRELQRLITDCINHRTYHNATVGRDTVKNRLQPEQTTFSQLLAFSQISLLHSLVQHAHHYYTRHLYFPAKKLQATKLKKNYFDTHTSVQIFHSC